MLSSAVIFVLLIGFANVATLLAALVPAHRATRVNPLHAVRGL